MPKPGDLVESKAGWCLAPRSGKFWGHNLGAASALIFLQFDGKESLVLSRHGLIWLTCWPEDFAVMNKK